MKREQEAIEQLKMLPIDPNVSKRYLEEIYDNVDVAIAALDKCSKIEKIIDSYDADFIANYVRALQMAIEVLEQEPCEDAISRQTVLAILKDKWNMFSDANDAMQESIDTIEALPSGAPQPKIGHWIAQPSNKEQGERDFIWWKCSECGHVIFSESDRDRKEFHAYCGRCGAKMEE